MWVIYNAETGMEIDSVEHYSEAKNIRDSANTNEYGNRFNMRYEDR